MNRSMLSTRGTTKSFVLMGVCSFVLASFSLIRIILPAVKAINSYPSYLRDFIPGKLISMLIIGMVLSVVTVVWGIFCLVSSRSYVEVFDDHIEGIGFSQGIKLMNFSITNEKITDVAYRGNDVCFHTTGGKYTVKTDPKTAKVVYDHFNK